MTMINDGPGESFYVLGHVATEIRRLLLQARLHDDFTEHALRLAGLEPGMRVLDVGCGPGDVSFAAARLVGPQGRVLGVDDAAEIVDLARSRAAELVLANVGFERCAIADLVVDEPVDAVIGRAILIHLPDPVAALRHLVTLVRPGGLVAFCEPDLTAAYTLPYLPLWESVMTAVVKAFERAGLDPAFGAKLHNVFRCAGLDAPRLTLGAPVGAPGDSDPVAYLVESWRSILSNAGHLDAMSDEATDLDTLTQRLHEEAAGAQAITVMPALICAGARV